ncbi:MAG: (Fe-S)-binding protein [Planctomycetota bacterium]
MRVSLFVPCFVDQLAPQIAVATARVLERLGHNLHLPLGQTCCGQPALNAGHFPEALHLARHQLEALGGGDPEAVVSPSGSCVAALRVLAPRHLGLDHPLLDRIFEFSQFLVEETGQVDVGASFEGRLTWHDACHPTRLLGIREGPRRLLAAVRGLELVEMESSDECCGFGGTFAMKFPAISSGIGARKVDQILASGADAVASTEPSCLMQIGGLLERRGSRVRALHLAEILAGER